ncbi:GDSL esterase/lipase At1g74460 [Amborella trichopoda]|uniref:GDSL esterase/lipase At1g74460 n=1 Tax=Amborella trichopoda TaxID=13333 RepID=UPI0009BD2F82|nr:GDSL esterase/lipase At1g74460 [Amborella trichopoda]|eukprot:XP_006827265.3 GDSL esterase/lipase At1g74460 [Amborella trichopoda]
MAMALMILLVLERSGKVRCRVVLFIFGDSLTDVGNNNYLNRTLAKANFPRYGIDMGNGKPTGRFTNGRTVADIVGDKMGLPRPPAFLDPSSTTDVILKNGANYASGGGGILNETGEFFVQRLSFYKQIELFQGTREMIVRSIGSDEADVFLKNADFVVAMGSNDFLNNFLLPIYDDYWTYNADEFTNYSMTILEKQLILLHSKGARRITFIGVGPLGCIPLARIISLFGGCQEYVNNIVMKFNNAANQLLQALSTRLSNSTFIFSDAYTIVLEIIDNPHKYGFDDSKTPCCTVGVIRPTFTCLPMSSLCKDRRKYVFWDEFHPSDAANEIIAYQIMSNL